MLKQKHNILALGKIKKKQQRHIAVMKESFWLIRESDKPLDTSAPARHHDEAYQRL